MKIHLYGQKGLVSRPENSTVKDLRQIARFNRIIKNYLKMKKIQKKA